MKLTEKVLQILKETNQQLTAREIAVKINEKFPSEVQEKQQKMKGNARSIIDQISAEIGSLKDSLIKSGISMTTGRPRKYFISNVNEDKIPTLEVTTKRIELSEHDLYPLLINYLKQEFHIKAKRIDERKSSNKQGKNGNQWLHPDIVGMEDLSSRWNNQIKELVKERDRIKSKFYSYEVKLEITRSNVRESFYQALSNSSWANLGYLVAPQIIEDCMDELRMLCARHGIGVILLDTDDVSESQILIPAKENENIDYNMMNRLCEENPDFKDYVEKLKDFYLTGKISFN